MADAITDAELAEWERLPEWLRKRGLWQTAGALERLIAAERERRSESSTRHHVAALNAEHADLVRQGVVSEEWLLRAKADVAVSEVPRPAPVVKVTECVGCLEFGRGDVDDNVADKPLWALIPVEAKGHGAGPYWGPRGRFRITVEFWPEGESKP